MAKSLFTSKAAAVKKKLSLHISSETLQRLDKIEKEAEREGVSFPLNDHVEDAIQRLVTQAENQLEELRRSKIPTSDFGVGSTNYNKPTA
ncbi:hypothetical protein [Gilvimarinus xylanilyticus]|uniref:Uncharacterized protein n=1 Tax=Gilvimarinus xylanilyticus TaxID=2944139 RepID=A0A9X2I1J1_9GAMM|nr:hypothetical protein [Gilvimarinus xylanilyticus]MCP8898973.1 hypothetical protein [Gilvimarinus xylanilyticus]